MTMGYLQSIQAIPPDTYRRLRRAVELGRWPDGKPLTRAQRESAMQAVIAWGALYLDEGERVGYIDRGHKAGETCEEPQDTPLSWR
jgi:uncharacterized protein YeaC (DUF1315 family)